MLKNSELIINSDGSIYHLNLCPSDIYHNIITVGDPERVDKIAKNLDEIHIKKQNREFKTVSGIKNGKKLTILSTGMGLDNIDIVMNELDALVNIDFETREIKKKHTTLNIVRVGTCGSIDNDVEVDSIAYTKNAYTADNVLFYYLNEIKTIDILNLRYYETQADTNLVEKFSAMQAVNTLTTNGFYAPQGRSLRLKVKFTPLDIKEAFNQNNINLQTIEMETAGLYAFSKMLGHRCISLNAILASRLSGTFSTKPEETINKLIQTCLKLF